LAQPVEHHPGAAGVVAADFSNDLVFAGADDRTRQELM